MSTVATQGAQPIPGYALLERIGAGAYGEVWRAEAPGGLIKAIKIVYGYHNEIRALRELKALRAGQAIAASVSVVARTDRDRRRPADHRHRAGRHVAARTAFLDCSRGRRRRVSPATSCSSHLRDAADALDLHQRNRNRCNIWTSRPKTCCWWAGGSSSAISDWCRICPSATPRCWTA